MSNNKTTSEIIADESESLEKAVIDLVRDKGLKIMTVESCTGGMVVSRLVNVPGASDVLECSLVTYCDEAKAKLLNVNPDTLSKYTAVSAETAEEMVKGPAVWNADVIIGVTGYASPCEDDSKSGLVYIACNVCGDITVKEFKFSGSREEVRKAAATQALILAKSCIYGHFSK
ncbi:MAG: CinA family protein [Lachnospiraceae bacterium]|nr:CinA family protein [Lachnospiraceae bacterium]